MSFQQGLSGLNASSKNLEVIGNNIANAQTYGAKSSRAEFGDMYASALNGAGTNQVGIGVQLQAVAQQFTQGNITVTENPMDLAVNGNGFFQVSDGKNPTMYTRNGQFKIDKDGNIVNNDKGGFDTIGKFSVNEEDGMVTIDITELPIKTWTQTYKEFLHEMWTLIYSDRL